MKGTIKYNITMGVVGKDWTEMELIQACQDANAYDFICDKTKFPLGFET